jgi:hypothetical protein
VDWCICSDSLGANHAISPATAGDGNSILTSDPVGGCVSRSAGA